MGGSRPSSFVFTQCGPLRLYSTVELLTLPPPEWLIDGIVTEGGLVGLFGQPEVGKSFIGIDMALSVATGQPWQGHQVRKGFVLYISAEGGSGIGKRVLAWLLEHQIDPREADVAWLIESIPVNTDSEQITRLMNRIVDEVRRRPVLIVIDTLARCFDGNENEQEDMGRFIAGVDMLRHEFEATVLVIHHTNVGGTRERGNTAFRGAVDTMIRVQVTDGVIDLTCDKQKDATHFPDQAFELVVIEAADSCVVRAAGAQADQTAETVWATLAAAPHGMSWSEWFQWTTLENSAFSKAFAALRRAKRVEKRGDVWVAIRCVGASAPER